MIIDASALLAILRDELDADRYKRAIADASTRRISAATFLEAAVVADGNRDPVTSRIFDDICREARLIIEPVTESQAHLARQAYRDFGRGSGHPAKLNFGDCFAYALAKALNEPLLFKGNDFSHTDVRSALS
jgi:ribonuclease VapC